MLTHFLCLQLLFEMNMDVEEEGRKTLPVQQYQLVA